MARTSQLVLVLLGALLCASAYTPPLTTASSPTVQIGCDLTFESYIDLIYATSPISFNGSSPYQSDPLSCPLKPNCRASSPSSPFTCFDGSCAASPLGCVAKSTYVCPQGPLSNETTKTSCWDGSCSRAEPYAMKILIPTTTSGTFAVLSTCPPLPSCRAGELRCWDLSCVTPGSAATIDAACSAYPFQSLVSACQTAAASTATAIKAYQCCGDVGGSVNNTYGICGAFYGCNFGQVQCADGTCVQFEDWRAGSCSKGCKKDSGEVRCYGKVKGKCVADASTCMQPPSVSMIVSEYIATVGVQASGENATRLGLRNSADGSDMGWLGVPPLNPTGSIHFNIFNYMTGTQLNDDKRSLQSGDWRSGERATTSVFSPIVGIFSYDLLLLYARDTPTYNESATKVVNTWAMEIVLPVFLPENVKINKMCLASADTNLAAGVIPIRGQGGWQCVDRKVELVENGTVPLYRGYAPLARLMAAEPFRHFAFVHDISDDFGPVESIGGGFFAAGVVLLVVGGTFLLANREKLMGRIYNDGGGTSTSAM